MYGVLFLAESKQGERLSHFLLCREDDFVHKEEHQHGHAAVGDVGANVVDEVRHQQACHRHPDAVDGVDDAGDETKRKDISADLLCQRLAALFVPKHEILLKGEGC